MKLNYSIVPSVILQEIKMPVLQFITEYKYIISNNVQYLINPVSYNTY